MEFQYSVSFIMVIKYASLSPWQELDMNKDGTVTPKEFKEKMEQQKNYTTYVSAWILSIQCVNKKWKK